MKELSFVNTHVLIADLPTSVGILLSFYIGTKVSLQLVFAKALCAKPCNSIILLRFVFIQLMFHVRERKLHEESIKQAD